MRKTYTPKLNEIERKCFLFDANGQILGRLATQVAKILMGKDEVFYTPNMECGDQVIIINAKQIRVTGRKATQKTYDHYTGWPSGRYEFTYEEMMEKKPEFIIREAVRRMLPKNRLRARMLKHLLVYADGTHPHQAQKPITVK